MLCFLGRIMRRHHSVNRQNMRTIIQPSSDMAFAERQITMTNKASTTDYKIESLAKSFTYALSGIAFAVKTERNARLHVLGAVIVSVAGVMLGLNATDWRWIIMCIALVWFSELVNTAFEYICDLVSPDIHPAVKHAKDIASGAVRTRTVGAVLVGGVTFWQYVAGVFI